MRLSFAAAFLAAQSAAALTGQGEECAIRLNQPVEGLEHFTAFLPAFQKVLEKLSPEDVPADETAAMKAICGDEGCPGGGVYTEYRNGTQIHGIVLEGVGNELWVIPDLGWIGGASACAIGEPAVQKVGEELYLVVLDERLGDFQGDEDAYCANEEYYRSVGLLDLRTKQWLVLAPNVGEAQLALEDGYATLKACDGLEINVALDWLRAGKGTVVGKAGAGAEATRAVNDGRKRTKAKDWKGAIAAFKKALALDPGRATAWSGLGFAQLGEGSLRDADASFERALAAGGEARFKAMVWFNRGLIAEKRKDRAAARLAFDNANTLFPSKAAAAKAKKYAK